MNVYYITDDKKNIINIIILSKEKNRKGIYSMENITVSAELKNNFKRAYTKLIEESNPIVMVAKVTILIGCIAIMYPYKLIKKSLAERELNIIEKLYSVLLDKIIRCLYLDRDTVRVNLVTTYEKDNKVISEEQNLFQINGMNNNNKITFVSKKYNFRISKTTVMFRLAVVADLCKTFYEYYIKERDSIGITVYMPKLKMVVFTVGFMLVNLPVILFI